MCLHWNKKEMTAMKVNLGEVLSKAWKIVWKFKVLWIFGILAGCAGGNSSRFNYNSSGSGGSGNSGQIPDFLRPFQNMRPGLIFQEFWRQYATITAAVIVLLCILWIIFYFLGVMGRTGLIKGASKADAGANSLTFGELWTESTPYFWRMFGLNLLVGLPFFILIVIMIVVLGFAGYLAFSNGGSGAGLGAMFIGITSIFVAVICVIAVLSIIVGMIVEQAQNALVLEDLGVLESLSRGWNVFKSAVLTIVVMAIILGVIGWVASLIIAIPFIAIAVPAAIGIIATGSRNFNTYFIPLLIAFGCCVIYLPVAWLLTGILQAYNQSVWTLTYRRLTNPAPSAPLAPAAPVEVSPVP
jgi:hypothetical protein